jgi:hypothetical protein
MERESFENEEVAAYLNRHFVAIKVDREERPDVDAVYMTAIQATGQGGGWPLSTFLDHGKRPFFLGTYFPPEDRYGRPGFLTVLRKMHEAWTTRRADVAAAGEELARFVKGAFDPPAPAPLSPETLGAAVRGFASRRDRHRGGFGDAPKFPRGHALSLLLRAAERPGLAEGRAMALETLRAMARGGIHDQVGGGFHRYATDGGWLVPHFEKMLYDQALLLEAYADGHRVAGDPLFARTARGIVAYVLRDLRHPEGGFLCAEDADSEGVEGKFYLWTVAELKAVLGPEEGAAAAKVLGCRDSGNFHGEAEEAPAGANILHRPGALAAADLAAEEKDEERIARWRPLLLAARSKRVRPHLDDKVLAAWNGMMVTALARAGRALEEPSWIAEAGRAADFVLGRMRGKDGRLHRTWRAGRAGPPGCLDDHAFLGLGLLDLFEATGDPRRLEEARDLAGTALRLFSAADGKGALYDAGAEAADLPARAREGDDGAVPSGNAAAATLLLRLGRLAGEPSLEARGREILRAYSGTMAEAPLATPALMLALDFDLGPTREIVLAGDPASEGFRALAREVDRRYLPNAVVARRGPGKAAAPWLEPYGPVDGKAAAYVCEGGTCKAPVTTVEALGRALEGSAAAK